MTPEQSVYKMLKYMVKKNYHVREPMPNNFIYTGGNLKLNIDAYDNYYDKDVCIDFTTKKATWNSGNDYGPIHKQGELNWNEFIILLQPILQQYIIHEIYYKLLQEETERTKKVRQLRTNCIMKRELDAIEGLAL